jgi:hypothetical protein
MSHCELARLKQRILSYLVEHPNAEDTVDGIRQWWLLDQLIRTSAHDVETALSCLVEEGWLLRIRRMDSADCYKVNTAKRQEIMDSSLQRGCCEDERPGVNSRGS